MAALVTMNSGLDNFFMSWSNMLLMALVAVSLIVIFQDTFHPIITTNYTSSLSATISSVYFTTSTSTLSAPIQDHGMRAAVAYLIAYLSCLADSLLTFWNCINATALSFASRPTSWHFLMRAHGRISWATGPPGSPNLGNQIACPAC